MALVLSKGLREKLGVDALISVLQQNRLRRYGHVLQKEDNDWMKKSMEYGARSRGRPKKTWIEIVEDFQLCTLNREDAMVQKRWRKQIEMIDDYYRCEWVNVSSGTGSPCLFQTKSREP